MLQLTVIIHVTVIFTMLTFAKFNIHTVHYLQKFFIMYIYEKCTEKDVVTVMFTWQQSSILTSLMDQNVGKVRTLTVKIVMIMSVKRVNVNYYLPILTADFLTIDEAFCYAVAYLYLF